MHAIKKSTNRFHDALRGALRHALVASLLTFGVLPLARATIIGGSVQTGTTIAPTGDGLCSLDPSPTDMNVCTNGQVTYSLEFVGNGGDNPVTLTSQLPVGAVWEVLPPSCSGPGSGISADGRTLTCVYPGPVAAGTVRILPTARISGALANGTQLPAPVTTFTSPQTPAPVAATDLSGPLTVLAKPSYDLIKATHSSPLQSYPGPNGEAGYLLRYSIMISVPAGSVQGQENLVQPIVVTDIVPANAALVEWGAGAPYTCHANSSAIPAYYTGNTNYPPGTGGSCDATQAGAGAPATLTLSGMNLTSGFQSYGNFVADFNLLLWIPASSLVPGNNVLTNSISWSPESISGQDNVDPDLGNQTVNDQVNNDPTVVRGNFEKYFNVAPYDGNGRLPADSTGSLLIYTRNPAITPQEKVLCEKYDNTRYQITAAGASMAVAGAVIEYGTGGLGGAGQTWASGNDQRIGTCADDQSPAWYTNLASVPGGMAAVTKIRARYLAPSGDSTFQAYFRVLGAYAFNGYATNNGPAIAGQSIPVGEKMINWTALQVVGATAATYDQADDQALQDSDGQWWGISRTTDPVASVYGDTLYVARAIASVTKSLLPANSPDVVAAGSVATYRLQPTLGTMNGVVGSTPTSVTLRDVLPPGLGYQPGTASIGEPSVQADVPASGYTTLVWTLDNVLPGAPLPPVDYQVLVDSFVQNSRILPNLVEVSSPLDPETCANSSGIYAGMLGNAVINSDTGAVGGTLCQRAARHDMSVSNPGGLQLQKTSDTPVISTNGTLQYTLTWGGIQSSVDRTDLIDVLPYNGDGRTPATNYNGGVAGTANLRLEYLVGPVANDGTPASVFYYTSAAAATIAPDPGHPSNALPGGSTRWCTSAEFGMAGCPASKDQATAFRVISAGVLASNTMRSVTVVLRTGGNRAGDVYTNAFNIRGTVDGQPLVALLDSNAVSAVTQAADVTVRKVLTTGGPTAEPGETLSYTITLTNNTGTPATDHAFYESIPAYTRYQSVTGATVADCAVGDAGRKTCTLTVASIPANATAEVVLNVQVASALPAGLTQLYNLVTDGVCDPADATCAPPPACDPATDANQCTTPPVGCDPATDPDHCVVTPVTPPPPFASCPANAFVTRDSNPTSLYDFNLATGAQTLIGAIGGINTSNAAGFRQQDGYVYVWANSPATGGAAARRFARVGANGAADFPFATAPTGWPTAAGVVQDAYVADVSPAGLYVALLGNSLYYVDVTINAVVNVVPLSRAVGGITDMAFHPTDGNLYTVNASNGLVWRIDPNSGTVTELTGITLPTNASGGGYGAIFFDSNGTMYPYKSGGQVYRVFNVDGSGTLSFDLLTGNAPTTSNLDGGACPNLAPMGPPAILLRKTTVGIAGGPFEFTLTGTTQGNGTVTTQAADTPVEVDGNNALDGVQTFTAAAIGQPVTISESTVPDGWSLQDAICVSNGVTVGERNGTTYEIPGAAVQAGGLIECELTNAQQPDIAVKKVLTTGGPTAEAGETLTYTITLTNSSATAATNHAFYESIPAYTAFQSATGATVADCAVGDTGRKTCTLTVASVPANGTSEVVLTVQVANTVPAGLTQLYNLVTDGVCDPADATCAPPPACDPATDANQCITPPVGCDPATDPDHCVVTPVQPPNVSVKKVLTTGGPTAEAGETLSYTITLTNSSATAATNHAFYESIPAYTTFQSVTGATVADCAVGDAGRKTCTLTVASVPANGTSEVVLTVQVASTLPAGLTQLYNLVTDGVCDPADTTCVPPPACNPATDPNQCTTPPVGCDPATDPDHCVTTPVAQPNVTVKKALTAESGTRPGIAENAETLTYTLTLTNNGAGTATAHAFYERLPEYTTLVSIDGSGVTHDCAVGDAGPKLCTITVAGPIAADGGTAQATVVLVTDDPLPTNVRRIFNLITDNTGEPPTGCDPATQVCTPPPACDPATDPNQCGTPLPGCDPATDPDHCVVTPIDPSSVTVRKQLTGEDGTVEGFVEPGETLTYTLTLTNDGGQSAAEHVFYEQLPAHVTLVGITGTGVGSNCAVGDVGSKLCQVTVVTPIAGDGGMATVTVVVKVADPLPAGVLTLVNLVTDNTDTPPPGCDPLTQVCGGDPELPPQCDPATDPAHCVSTPVAALLTVEKSVLGVPQPVAGTGDEFTVRYAVTVRNAGGSVGRYDLGDTPQFDADASVVSAQSTRGQETAVALQGASP
ncbi:MAG: DUF11 domain-containing protein [Lysobacteraceae bacterium]|nr:MAG: DUF11 domain-containing protein [Xanthomonadaceae bacterium]